MYNHSKPAPLLPIEILLKLRADYLTLEFFLFAHKRAELQVRPLYTKHEFHFAKSLHFRR